MASIPLAERLRPTMLADYSGQQHLLGDNYLDTDRGREAVELAQGMHANFGRRILLCAGQVHRFNKAVKYYVNQRFRKIIVQMFWIPHDAAGANHG